MVLLGLRHLVLTKDGYAVSVQLSLLDGTSLHVHLLVVNLLHLISICLFYKGLDRIKLARSPS